VAKGDRGRHRIGVLGQWHTSLQPSSLMVRLSVSTHKLDLIFCLFSLQLLLGGPRAVNFTHSPPSSSQVFSSRSASGLEGPRQATIFLSVGDAMWATVDPLSEAPPMAFLPYSPPRGVPTSFFLQGGGVVGGVSYLGVRRMFQKRNTLCGCTTRPPCANFLSKGWSLSPNPPPRQVSSSHAFRNRSVLGELRRLIPFLEIVHLAKGTFLPPAYPPSARNKEI